MAQRIKAKTEKIYGINLCSHIKIPFLLCWCCVKVQIDSSANVPLCHARERFYLGSEGWAYAQWAKVRYSLDINFCCATKIIDEWDGYIRVRIKFSRTQFIYALINNQIVPHRSDQRKRAWKYEFITRGKDFFLSFFLSNTCKYSWWWSVEKKYESERRKDFLNKISLSNSSSWCTWKLKSLSCVCSSIPSRVFFCFWFHLSNSARHAPADEDFSFRCLKQECSITRCRFQLLLPFIVAASLADERYDSFASPLLRNWNGKWFDSVVRSPRLHSTHSPRTRNGTVCLRFYTFHVQQVHSNVIALCVELRALHK